jgi:hypothetical protein
MDVIKENKTLAAILGVMVVGGLGLVALLVTSYLGFTSSMEQFETASNAVATLKGAKLFPSEENVKEKEASVVEYEQAVNTLGTVLLKLQQPVAPLSETEFQAKLKSGIARVKGAAGNATKLPKEFAFGFDTYTSSLPKSAQVATELGDYLAAVEAVTDLAIASGVASIDSIARSELQVEKGAPPPAPPPPTKKGGAKSAAGKGTGKAVKEIAKVVERRTLTLTLTADQAPLQKLMNELASPSRMPYFTVVRQLRIENEKQEGPLRGSLSLAPPPDAGLPAPTEPLPGGTPDAAAAPKVEVIEPAKPAAPDAQAVFGDEKLKIYLEIDIVRYLEPAAV